MYMSTATIKYYHSTLAYQQNVRNRRMQEFKKRFRTQISRRKIKQYLQTAVNHFNKTT